MNNKQQLLDEALEEVSGGASSTQYPNAKYRKNSTVKYNNEKCLVNNITEANGTYLYRLKHKVTKTYWEYYENIPEDLITNWY